MKYMFALLLLFSAGLGLQAEVPHDETIPEAGKAIPPFNQGWDEPISRGVSETVTAGLWAAGYITLKNLIVMSYNRFIWGAWWGFPTASTIRRNFTQPWKWEHRDGFLVNHIGHPIQGWIYFSSGRTLGFGFYESIFFSTFGSFTWEVFGEGLGAALNDFIVTPLAGASLGEMMHRLYMQAHAAGAPAFLSAFLNPSAGIHRLITRWEPPIVEPNFYEIRTYVAASLSDTTYSVSSHSTEEGSRELFSHMGPFLDVGFRIVYGDPFVQNTWIPFRHFEFNTSFGSDFSNYIDFRLFSSGFLFSFSPLHTATQALSHGLSLHYDFASLGEISLFDSTINMYSNALGWTVNYRHLFPQNISWRSRTHAGIIFFGVSNYYSPSEDGRTVAKNYGYGITLRHLSSLEFGRRSRIDVNSFLYFLWSYPDLVAISQGFVWWQFHDINFSFMVSPRISFGTSFSIATERGTFAGFPDTRKSHWAVRTFVAWHGRSIRGGRF